MTSDSGAEIEYHGTNGQARLAVRRSVAARMRLCGAKQIATDVRQGDGLIWVRGRCGR